MVPGANSVGGVTVIGLASSVGYGTGVARCSWNARHLASLSPTALRASVPQLPNRADLRRAALPLRRPGQQQRQLALQAQIGVRGLELGEQLVHGGHDAAIGRFRRRRQVEAEQQKPHRHGRHGDALGGGLGPEPVMQDGGESRARAS